MKNMCKECTTWYDEETCPMCRRMGESVNAAFTAVIETAKEQNILIIDGRKPAICSMCQKEDELRPYGPSGSNVCFDCAMKDEPEAQRQFAKLLLGKNLIIIK